MVGGGGDGVDAGELGCGVEAVFGEVVGVALEEGLIRGEPGSVA